MGSMQGSKNTALLCLMLGACAPLHPKATAPTESMHSRESASLHALTPIPESHELLSINIADDSRESIEDLRTKAEQATVIDLHLKTNNEETWRHVADVIRYHKNKLFLLSHWKGTDFNQANVGLGLFKQSNVLVLSYVNEQHKIVPGCSFGSKSIEIAVQDLSFVHQALLLNPHLSPEQMIEFAFLSRQSQEELKDKTLQGELEKDSFLKKV